MEFYQQGTGLQSKAHLGSMLSTATYMHSSCPVHIPAKVVWRLNAPLLTTCAHRFPQCTRIAVSNQNLQLGSTLNACRGFNCTELPATLTTTTTVTNNNPTEGSKAQPPARQALPMLGKSNPSWLSQHAMHMIAGQPLVPTDSAALVINHKVCRRHRTHTTSRSNATIPAPPRPIIITLPPATQQCC